MNEQQQKTIYLHTLSGIIACVLALGLTLIFTLFGWWQFIWVGPFLGGIFFLKSRYGILLGMISVTIVWLFYLLYQIYSNSLLLLYDQLGVLIFGNLGYSWIFVTGILIIGVFFGVLGGWCGSSLRQFLQLQKKKNI